MREDIAGPQGASSRPMWETLEGMVREKAQEFIQQIMEEEITVLLGNHGVVSNCVLAQAPNWGWDSRIRHRGPWR